MKMKKGFNGEINKLASLAQKGNDYALSDLYEKTSSTFAQILNDYKAKNNLLDFSFDDSDYYSAIGQALWEAVKEYDIHKGNFMSRLTIFARNRMKEITDINLAQKRTDLSQGTYSTEVLFEKDEFDIVDTDSNSDLEGLIADFIKTDKHGQVISILMSSNTQDLRREQFIEYFGKFGATERKWVQRTKERLKKYLAENELFV